MKEIINNILSKNAYVIDRRNKSITFDQDFEGKGFLNKEISKLYDKKTILSEQEFADIIINSDVIITKMAKLKKCEWDISELKNQLLSGVANYQKRNGNDILNNNFPAQSSKLLNTTAIGDHFKISRKRMNLLLNEIGWIEKTVQGWAITQLGKSLGGKQIKHETSGNTSVLWPDIILKNNNLLELFQETPKANPITPALIIEKVDNETVDDFRKKYPAEYRTKDGHYVRSKAELTIDDSLYLWGIAHAYEKKLPNTEKVVYSDFHIPSGNDRPKAVYIEYWGLENDEKYNKRKAEKIEIYKQLGLILIQLNDADIKNIEDSLQKYLLQYGIKVN